MLLLLSILAGTYSTNYSNDMHQKNFIADQTNPNVYHSIDENNEEHVYDEIKHKEGYKDPGKKASSSSKKDSIQSKYKYSSL